MQTSYLDFYHFEVEISEKTYPNTWRIQKEEMQRREKPELQ